VIIKCLDQTIGQRIWQKRMKWNSSLTSLCVMGRIFIVDVEPTYESIETYIIERINERYRNTLMVREAQWVIPHESEIEETP
jgi:hypothetical protein